MKLILSQALYQPWDLVPTLLFVAAILLFIVGVFLGKQIKGNNKIFNLIVLIMGVIFVSLEAIHEIGRYKEFGHYDWSSFPFQFCSVSMYLALIVPFVKSEKVRQPMIMFFGLFTALSGLLPLVFAQQNLTRWSTFTGVMFSFCWHILLMFLGGFSIGFQEIGSSIKVEYKTIISCLLIFVGITCFAQVLNVAIHYLAGGWEKPLEGFKQIDYIKDYILDPDSCSLFYISPYFKSNIPVVLDVIWEKAGWYTCWIVYDLAFCVGACSVYFLIYGIRTAFNSKIK